MNGENHVAELNAALAAAQGEFGPILKEQTAKAGTYSYSYASLDAILAVCRPVLARHGLALMQHVEDGPDLVAVRTELRHSAGAVVESTWRRPMVEGMQAQGSAITYMRRYAVTAILGVAAEEDDDGQAAADAKPKRRAKPKPDTGEMAATPEPDKPRMPTAAPSPDALKRMFALFNEKGFADREARLAYSERVLGRRIGSSQELMAGDVSRILDELLQEPDAVDE